MDWNRIDDGYGLAKIWCGKTSMTGWTLNRNGCR
jgi:hypothetical protein